MAGSLEIEDPIGPHHRDDCVEILAQEHAGVHRVEVSSTQKSLAKEGGEPLDPPAELVEDSPLFPLQFGLGHLEVIVGLDDLVGLDKDRLSRTRCVVDDAQALPFVAHLDGQDVAVVAQGQEVVLQGLPIAFIAAQRLQGAADGLVEAGLGRT